MTSSPNYNYKAHGPHPSEPQNAPIWHLTLRDPHHLTGHITNAPDGAVLCFSMMAPVALKSKGQILRSVGGYTEILTELRQDFSLSFQDEIFEIFNIGWQPDGGTLSAYNGFTIGDNPFPEAFRLELTSFP